MINVAGYAAESAAAPLKPTRFTCDDPGADDVQIDIMFCGVCHSDLHQARNDWGNTVYPCMPGHEIIGRAVRVGGSVSRIKVGDIVGVGCMINSCRQCAACREGAENYCEGPNSCLLTYNGPMIPASQSPTGTNMYGRDNTFGGYSTSIVVTQDFVLKVPEGLDPAHAAPILCAGITTFSPMKHWGVKQGDRVGVIGFGGLGDMATKIARALGARVTVFSTSTSKQERARASGADDFVVSKDAGAMARLGRSFDFLLDTIPVGHDINPYVALLKHDRTLAIVGALQPLEPLGGVGLIAGRRSVAGSLIGGIAETQEVLDFCARHGIAPDIKVVRIQEINEVFDSLARGEAAFRYVIDSSSLRQAD